MRLLSSHRCICLWYWGLLLWPELSNWSTRYWVKSLLTSIFIYAQKNYNNKVSSLFFIKSKWIYELQIDFKVCPCTLNFGDRILAFCTNCYLSWSLLRSSTLSGGCWGVHGCKVYTECSCYGSYWWLWRRIKTQPAAHLSNIIDLTENGDSATAGESSTPTHDAAGSSTTAYSHGGANGSVLEYISNRAKLTDKEKSKKSASI